MSSIMERLKKLWEETSKKEIAILCVMLALVIGLLIYAVYTEVENSKGIEIINSPSFVGEVVDKTRSNDTASMLPFPTSPPIYRIHIVGEYLSDNDEVMFFDMNLRVNYELYNRYETGDIISY